MSDNLSSDELAELRRVLESSGFDSIPADHPPVEGDGVEHAIWYGGREIRAVDNAVPPALEPVIGELREIVDRHG